MQNRSIPERDIENLLEQKLKKQGYVFDLGDGNRNVYMQKPKTNEESNLLKGKIPDYLIYLNKNRTHPDIVIEVKKNRDESKKNISSRIRICKFIRG